MIPHRHNVSSINDDMKSHHNKSHRSTQRIGAYFLSQFSSVEQQRLHYETFDRPETSLSSLIRMNIQRIQSKKIIVVISGYGCKDKKTKEKDKRKLWVVMGARIGAPGINKEDRAENETLRDEVYVHLKEIVVMEKAKERESVNGSVQIDKAEVLEREGMTYQSSTILHSTPLYGTSTSIPPLTLINKPIPLYGDASIGM